VSIANLRIDNIYYAIEALKREAERASWNAQGVEQRDRARDMKRTADDASREYSALSAAMPRLRDLSAAADREYDRHVTRVPEPEADCCSCHLSAPCSFCTREADEEADAA
jgi:ABC-type transporter lipoprotein component MlaA